MLRLGRSLGIGIGKRETSKSTMLLLIGKKGEIIEDHPVAALNHFLMK